MILLENPLFLLFLYPGILGAFADPSPAAKNSKSILLSRVKTLTLRAGRMTSHRRVDPIPQLKCVGGDAQGLHEVDVMRCTNMDYSENPNDEEYEISWTCVANLPHFFKLGSTDVICEGYSSAEDPAVLKGSCGVEYRLMLTEAGHEKYRTESDTDRQAKKKSKAKAKEKEKEEEEAAKKAGEGGILPVKEFMLFLLLVVVFFGGIMVKALLSPAQPPPPAWNANGGGGGGPGGGGDGGDGGGGGNNWRAGRADPPPAYDSDYMVKSTRPVTARSASSASYGRRGGQPGFWTGAAAGAAVGAAGTYLATGAAGASSSRSSPSSVNGRRSSSYGNATRRGWAGDDGVYQSNWGGASSSSGSWDEMHDSTGFGQTRRR